jgi:polysaccharide deacetylase 2 family uncharacterized protein YibQ
MAMKNQKGRSKSKKKLPIFVIGLLAVTLVFAILLFFHIYSPITKRTSQSPIYEEIYVDSTGLNQKIWKINSTIYEVLYKNGIEDRNVHFSDVQPRNGNGLVWEFAKLSVKCPDLESAEDLEKVLKKRVSALGPSIALRKEKSDEKQIVGHIYAQEFLTHTIVFTYKNVVDPVPKQKRPKVAIIIDDLGYDPKIARSFLALDFPLSFSVLPQAPFTRRIVEAVNSKGAELILHLPMEPKNYPKLNPGPGSLLLSMDEAQIQKVLENDLRQIPGAKGVNNHMGSSFTENRDMMLIVLRALKHKDLYYIDSRTTGRTVGYQLARELGLKAGRRSVFLDNDRSPKAIAIQMEKLLSMARHSGTAIGIGHPHKETIEILKKYAAETMKEFEFVRVSALLG